MTIHRFLPARTMSEARSRILNLTGDSQDSRIGGRSALCVLRDALNLQIEGPDSEIEVACQLASALDVDWRPKYQTDSRVTLAGVNALLQATSAERYASSLRILESQRPEILRGSAWAGFTAAVSKIEAVNRISALTNSGPEGLGPGSKERKSVLSNLSSALAPLLDSRLSKTKLAAALASEFNAPWTPKCHSRGETISLLGLNVLLAGAERLLGKLGDEPSVLLGTPEAEGKMLSSALIDAWPAEEQADGSRRVIWDGRKCIKWMYENGVTNGPHQNEWQGFYWESRALEVLNSAFRQNPHRPNTVFGKTTFDYSLNYVWDLKVHTKLWRNPLTGVETRAKSPNAPLNDRRAMDACISEQGLGFLVASGVGVKDQDGAFVEWHRDYKRSHGVTSTASNSGKSRMRKRAFEVFSVDAYFFRDSAAFDSAKAAGVISGFAQGAQAPKSSGESGVERAAKYKLNTKKAQDSTALVADFIWH